MVVKRKGSGSNGINEKTVSTKGDGLFHLGDTAIGSIVHKKPETADVLLFDENRLWNLYLQNPTVLDHDQRKYLGSKLDTLNISETDKRTFCSFRTEYDKEPKEKMQMTLPGQAAIEHFKLFLRDIARSGQTMEGIHSRILDMKNRLIMSEQDLKQCISIAKEGMKTLHYTGAAKGYQTLVTELETDLVLRLRSRYNDTKEPLTQSEWKFLADYVTDYDDNLEIGADVLKEFYFQGRIDGRSNQKIDDPEKAEMWQYEIERLFAKTAKVQQKISKLGTMPGYKMPEEGYKPEKTGGFANLSVGGKDEIRQLGDGPILSKEDAVYGTNAPKYSRHATQKVFQLFTHPEEVYSEATPIKIAGGLAFDFKGEKVIFSYSGGTPLQDQAIVIIGAHDAGRMSDEEFAQKQETLNNPYLTEKFLHDLDAKV